MNALDVQLVNTIKYNSSCIRYRKLTKTNNQSGAFDSEQRITLGLLTAVHNKEKISQRLLASELSIALGLANTYLKRCIKKGLIKVKQAPANRYAYYLTPKGFLEKTHLTAEFLSQSLSLFRLARDEAENIYQICQKNEWHQLVLLGDGDLIDIFIMSAPTENLRLSRFSKTAKESQKASSYPLFTTKDQLKIFDAAIICDMKNPAYYSQLSKKIFIPEKILIPGFLGVNKNAAPSGKRK